jgi:transposase
LARCASSSFTGGVECLEEIRSRKESAEAQLRPRENEKQVRCARGEVVHWELEQRRTRRRNDPWPENIGIAEHSFRRDPVQKQTEYWPLFVDHVGGRVDEPLQGRQSSDLFERLKDRPSVKRLKHVTMTFPRALVVSPARSSPTLRRSCTEILNDLSTGLTNARTEGFNNTAKLVKRRAYGYRNDENDRLRLLDTCFG